MLKMFGHFYNKKIKYMIVEGKIQNRKKTHLPPCQINDLHITCNLINGL